MRAYLGFIGGSFFGVLALGYLGLRIEDIGRRVLAYLQSGNLKYLRFVGYPC